MSYNDAEDYAGLPATSTPDPHLTVTCHGRGYDLVVSADGREGIRCRRCTLVSHDPFHIQMLYCTFCDEYHLKGDVR